jgi:hypothetical protein
VVWEGWSGLCGGGRGGGVLSTVGFDVPKDSFGLRFAYGWTCGGILVEDLGQMVSGISVISSVIIAVGSTLDCDRTGQDIEQRFKNTAKKEE